MIFEPTMQNSSNSSNSNGGNCSVEDEFKYTLYSAAFSIVFILGLLFNIVALYIFICSLKQRSETTTYMLNLAVCDTLFVLSLPFRIYYFLNKQNWPFGVVLCKISVSLFYMNMYGSMLFLTCICADRFLAIVYPFASRSLRTRRNAKIACCSVWLLVLSISLAAGFQLKTSSKNNTYCFEKFTHTQWKVELFSVVLVMETVGFVIPLLINLFCSMMILRTLRNLDAIKSEGQLNKAKILRMIVVHLLVFCFCFIPYNVNLVFYSLVRSEAISNCTVKTIVKTLYPITLCIAVTNCCFDPVIYYFTSETIQNCIKRKSLAIRSTRKHCDNPDNEPPGNTAQFLTAKLIFNESTV